MKAVSPPEPKDNVSITLRWFTGRQSLMLSLPEQIAAQVGDRIVRSEIAPGERITEQSLVNEFGVSRAPVREALRILERERLVRIHPRKGVTAASLSPEDVREIFDISVELYRLVGRRLAEIRNEAVIACLEAGIGELESLADAPDQSSNFAEAGYRMGLALVRQAGNARLEQIVSGLALESIRYRMLAYRSPEHRQRTVVSWRAVLRAVKKGDADATAERLSQIVASNRELALAHVAQLAEHQQSAT